MIIPARGAVLGSGSNCDIFLDERTLAQKHCCIVFENDQWIAKEVGSRSVFINGQKTVSSPLKQGDRIELGALILKVVSLPVSQAVPSTNQRLPDSVQVQESSGSPPTAADTAKGQTREGTIRFACKCGKVHILKAAFAGKTALCDQCGANFTVPTETASECAAPSQRNAPSTVSEEDNVLQVVPSTDNRTRSFGKVESVMDRWKTGIICFLVGLTVSAVAIVVTHKSVDTPLAQRLEAEKIPEAEYDYGVYYSIPGRGKCVLMDKFLVTDSKTGLFVWQYRMREYLPSGQLGMDFMWPPIQAQ